MADEDPERAEGLIESAGMKVKKTSAPAKPVFDVRPGPVSGSVRMAVRAAGDRASYQWAWSTDGGETWHLAPATVQARTVLSGLASGSTCALRYRVVTKAGEGDWSDPALLLVR